MPEMNGSIPVFIFPGTLCLFALKNGQKIRELRLQI
jgi:hypothetical protein